MDEISLKALAKINLGLDVLGKREDGYHDVRMIMQTIHLYDRVEIKKTRSPHIHVETNLYYLPVNEDNLVYRAAKLMKDEFQIKEGVRIVLQKFIPVAAGCLLRINQLLHTAQIHYIMFNGETVRSHHFCLDTFLPLSTTMPLYLPFHHKHTFFSWKSKRLCIAA